MWNVPTEKELSEIPCLYQNDNSDIYDAIVHEHFFIGGCDWFVTEYDGKGVFYGFAILNQDYINAEWGYFSLDLLKNVKIGFLEIDRDLFWKKRPARAVETIMNAVSRQNNF